MQIGTRPSRIGGFARALGPEGLVKWDKAQRKIAAAALARRNAVPERERFRRLVRPIG